MTDSTPSGLGPGFGAVLMLFGLVVGFAIGWLVRAAIARGW